MAKICLYISGFFLGVWIIFLIIASNNNDFTDEQKIICFFITIGIAIGSFLLSYLGGHIVKKNKGAFRLGVLIAVLWLIGFIFAVQPDWLTYKLEDYIGLGVIPVIVYFGTIAVVSGFLESKIKRDEDAA